VLYHDVGSPDAKSEIASVVEEIEARGLLYPVTAVDGVLVYDGAVSYPAIMRAVHNKLLEREQAQA
jgi:disulfide oxidoreductase YuzD